MITVQRVNTEIQPPRFEWLVACPTGNGEDASWTPDHAKALPFLFEDASEWAEALGATVTRFGDAPAVAVSALDRPSTSPVTLSEKRADRAKKAQEAAAVEAEAVRRAAMTPEERAAEDLAREEAALLAELEAHEARAAAKQERLARAREIRDRANAQR